jgi:hypothetical protein
VRIFFYFLSYIHFLPNLYFGRFSVKITIYFICTYWFDLHVRLIVASMISLSKLNKVIYINQEELLYNTTIVLLPTYIWRPHNKHWDKKVIVKLSLWFKLVTTTWRRMACWGIAPHILNLGTSWTLVVSFTTWSLNPKGKTSQVLLG